MNQKIPLIFATFTFPSDGAAITSVDNDNPIFSYEKPAAILRGIETDPLSSRDENAIVNNCALDFRSASHPHPTSQHAPLKPRRRFNFALRSDHRLQDGG